jgi:dTDP-4-amino-4,6-dideoxygalactose transaminase
MKNIGFNAPYLSGKELEYIADAVSAKKLSGNGKYTQRCHSFFETRYGFKKCLLTTSCTDALEMAALLCDIQPGDEVIIPSFTFVSTANPFVMRGAKIRFADSRTDHPGIDEDKIEPLINQKTKVIVAVHYAGVACDMNKIMALAAKYNLLVVEDAAQAIESYYRGKPLGSIGHLSAFSFHETKNIISGEGGMLVINDDRFLGRAEIIWEKGTNRSAFFRGDVDKYSWVDIGSSFLPSEIIAAFLFAQLECLARIQARRMEIWNTYDASLKSLEAKEFIKLPGLPDYGSGNAHMFYFTARSPQARDKIIQHLASEGIQAVFHYQSLHKSPYFHSDHDGRDLPQSDRYSETLLRLPFYFDLKAADQERIVNAIKSSFYGA